MRVRVGALCHEGADLCMDFLSWRSDVMSRSSFPRPVRVVATLLLSSAFAIPALTRTVSFIVRRDFPAGASPRSAAVDDFDGDGALDLAVTAAFLGLPLRWS